MRRVALALVAAGIAAAAFTAIAATPASAGVVIDSVSADNRDM